MNTQKIKTVSAMAIKDINEYLRPLLKEQQKEQRNEDNYIFTSQYLQTKETRKLNRELGIGGINKKK